MSMFKRAVKAESFLRLALVGPAGSGKTYTALALATALADGKPIAVIDTERGSASKYSDLFAFDVLELTSFHPKTYVDAINEAVANGYAVVVVDSLSHAWSGRGGILEIVQRKGSSFQAWGEVKPIEAALVEALTGARIHVIATMRSKTDYVVEQNAQGKAAPRKVGLAPVQREGMEYEFDVFGELDQENTLTIQKTRCPALAGAILPKPGKPLAETLRIWLGGMPGTAEAPSAAHVSQQAQQAQHTEADDETIPYSLDEQDEDAKPETAQDTDGGWKYLQDVPFRQLLNKLDVRTVADIEGFVTEACAGMPQPDRDEAMAVATRLLLAKKRQPGTSEARGRGPRALAATRAPGEPIPHDLRALGAGGGRN